MQQSRYITIVGLALYVIGAISSNIFLEPLPTPFSFHPALELLLFSTAFFFLSTLFYGRLSFILMLCAGLWIGSAFPKSPVLAILAPIPLLMAVAEGSLIGEKAFLDLRGKKNLFEGKEKHLIALLKFSILALAIGYLFAETQLPELPFFELGF